MYKRKIKQILASVLCFVAALNILIVPSSAEDEGVGRTFGDLSAMMTGYLNDVVGTIHNIQSDDTNFSMSDTMTNYVKYLVYMDMITQYGFHKKYDNGGSNSLTYTVIENTGEGTNELATRCIEANDVVLNLLNGKCSDLYNGGSDFVETGKLNATNITSHANGEQLFENAYFNEQLIKVLKYYIDANVLQVTLKANGVSSGSYDSMKSTVSGKTESEATAMLNKAIDSGYGNALKAYASIYNTLRQTADVIGLGNGSKPVIVASSKEDGFAWEPDVASSFNFDYKDVSTLLITLWTSLYTTSSSSALSNIDGDIVVPETKSVMELISNMTFSKDGVGYPTDGDPELTDIGYRILAAGIVYDPLVSKTGNDFFTSVVLDQVSNDESIEKIKEALNKAYAMKKPLYVTTVNTTVTDVSIEKAPLNSDYHIAHLSDLIDPTGTGGLNVFVAKTGWMTPEQADSSTWDYYQGSLSSDPGDLEFKPAADCTVKSLGANGQLSSTEVTQPLAAVTTKTQTSGWNVKGIISAVGGLTSVIMHNAALNVDGSVDKEMTKSGILFVNGLGDIVLLDDTVVLPAIANPMLYVYDDKNAMQSDSTVKATDAAVDANGNASTQGFTIDQDSSLHSYYPYNAAFFNNYPGISRNSNYNLYLTNAGDEGKYILRGSTVFSITKAGERTKVKKTKIDSMIPQSFSLCPSGNDSDILNAMPMVRAQAKDWDRDMNYYMCKTAYGSDSGIDCLPIPTNKGSSESQFENNLAGAAYMVTSCVHYLTDTSDTTTTKSAGTFRIEAFLKEYVAEALKGTQRAEVLAANFAVSYESIVADTGTRFQKFLAHIVTSVLTTFGQIDGILAMKNPYENTFFRTLLNFVQDFYPLLVVMLMLVLARSFIKGRVNFVYVMFTLVAAISGLTVYAYVLPDWLTSAYNVAVNDIVEPVSWATVAHSANDYDQTYARAYSYKVEEGEVKANTATITLYKLTNYEITELAAEIGVDDKDIKSGRAYYLDDDAGIFVQGNRIKMSLDMLFVNNSMRGLTQSQWEEMGATDTVPVLVPEAQNPNPYSLQLEDPYVSLEAYYTPYCHIERSLLQNMNMFSNLFMIPRENKKVGKDFYKDAFLYSAYTQSGIVTAPGDDEILSLNISYDALKQKLMDVDDVINLTHEYFDPQDDWLNLRSIFANPSDSVKNSLWGQMLMKQGYYTDDWEIDEKGNEKFGQLISYVNEQTKVWLSKVYETDLKTGTDENNVKLTALFATTAFNHKVSQFGDWLYPNYFDAATFSLDDVLYSSMTEAEDRYFSYDSNTVNSTLLNLGSLGLILLLFITVIAAIYIFVLSYLVPILYAFLGLVVIYKLSNSETASQVVSGYVKITLISVLSYVGFGFAFRLPLMANCEWYGFLSTLVVLVICSSLLASVIIAVILDPLTMGDTTIKTTITGMADKLTHGLVGSLNANSFRLNRGQFDTAVFQNAIGGYHRGISMDSLPLSTARRTMDNRYGAGYYSRSPFGRIGGYNSIGFRERRRLRRGNRF